MNKFLKLLVKPLAIIVFLCLLCSSCHPHVKSISRRKLKRGQTFYRPVDNKSIVTMTMNPMIKSME